MQEECHLTMCSNTTFNSKNLCVLIATKSDGLRTKTYEELTYVEYIGTLLVVNYEPSTAQIRVQDSQYLTSYTSSAVFSLMSDMNAIYTAAADDVGLPID